MGFTTAHICDGINNCNGHASCVGNNILALCIHVMESDMENVLESINTNATVVGKEIPIVLDGINNCNGLIVILNEMILSLTKNKYQHQFT